MTTAEPEGSASRVLSDGPPPGGGPAGDESGVARPIDGVDVDGPAGVPVDGAAGVPVDGVLVDGPARVPVDGAPADHPADAADGATAPRTARAVDDRVTGAVLALLLGGGLGLCAAGGATALLVGVVVAQALLVLAWVLATGLPGRAGAVVIGGLVAAGADVAVSVWPHGQLGTLLAPLGLALPLMFVHQLVRGVARQRVVESLSDIGLLVVAVTAFAAIVQLRHETGGARLTATVLLAAAAALVVGHLVDLVLPAPRFDPDVPRGLTAVVLGAAAAGAVGFAGLHRTVEFASGRGAFLGAALGAVVGLLAVGAAFAERASSLPGGRAERLRPVVAVLLPLALLCAVGYLLALAIRG